MKRRLRTTLVYFGLVEDPEIDAALRAAPLNALRVATVAGAGLLLCALVLLVAEVVGLLALVLAFTVLLALLAAGLPRDEDDDARAETHPAPPPRAILRQLAYDAYAYIMLWVVLAFVAQVLGRELSDRATNAVLLSLAGFVVLDAARLVLRRRRAGASRAIRP